MSVPQTKAELLKEIDKNFLKLLHYLSKIPPVLAFETSMEGHAKSTMMSVADLVAYLLGWNALVVKWIEADAEHQAIDFPETGYKWNQLGLLAQKFYSDYRGLNFPERIAELCAVKEKIECLINDRSDETLYGSAWYGKWTMGRMISFNTSSPYANANGRIRKWAKVHGVKL